MQAALGTLAGRAYHHICAASCSAALQHLATPPTSTPGLLSSIWRSYVAIPCSWGTCAPRAAALPPSCYDPALTRSVTCSLAVSRSCTLVQPHAPGAAEKALWAWSWQTLPEPAGTQHAWDPTHRAHSIRNAGTHSTKLPQYPADPPTM
jgi:hypothetical protein